METRDDKFAKACAQFRDGMSPKRSALFDAMVAKIGNGWDLVPGHGFTIRWDQELPTPDFYRKPYRELPPVWDYPTYTNHVFLTMITPQGSLVMGTCRGPGSGRDDQFVSLKRASDVLENPAGALEVPPISNGKAA
jgi:hypothetical protein